MKRCPQCRRTYRESFRFCLDDGTTLDTTIDLDAPTRIFPRIQRSWRVKQKHSQVVLVAIGVFVLLVGVIGIIKGRTILEGIWSPTLPASVAPTLLEPTVRTYFDYITLEPGSYPGTMNCRVVHHVTLRFEVPEGQQAVYRGRIKSRGRTALDSNPSRTVLNPDQFRDNPSYLEFSIENKMRLGSSLDIEAVASEETMITRELGWVGSHMPYRTEYAVLVIDYSKMKFNNFSHDVQGLIEFRGVDGSNHVENMGQILHPEVADDTIVLMRRNLPAGSSIVLKWGTQR